MLPKLTKSRLAVRLGRISVLPDLLIFRGFLIFAGFLFFVGFLANLEGFGVGGQHSTSWDLRGSNDTHSCSNIHFWTNQLHIGVQSSHCSDVQQSAKWCWPPLLFFVAPFAVLEDRGGEMMSESWTYWFLGKLGEWAGSFFSWINRK